MARGAGGDHGPPHAPHPHHHPRRCLLGYLGARRGLRGDGHGSDPHCHDAYDGLHGHANPPFPTVSKSLTNEIILGTLIY